MLSGRGTELERGHALGVARQCLLPVVLAERRGGGDRLFEGAAALAAPVVLDGTDENEPTTPFAILHGLYWLVSNLTAQRPALLAIDEAQWADEASPTERPGAAPDQCSAVRAQPVDAVDKADGQRR